MQVCLFELRPTLQLWLNQQCDFKSFNLVLNQYLFCNYGYIASGTDNTPLFQTEDGEMLF